MQIDRTTLADLEVFRDSTGRGGLFALIDRTQTEGGSKALRRRMQKPFTDPEEIRATQRAVTFFATHPRAMQLRADAVPPVSRHLQSNIVLTRTRRRPFDTAHAYWYALRYRDLYRELREGVLAARSLLRALVEACRNVLALDPPDVVRSEAERVLEICTACASGSGSASAPAVLREDRLLRATNRDELEELILRVAELDALRAMGRATSRFGWTMPEILDGEQFLLDAEGIVHPFVERAVANPIGLSGGEPMVFLTGPNMAGKTTYLRATALLVLLGQMGMGVPATGARLTPIDVLLTSLNPADNLRAGLSFFFSEVLRVQAAARQLAAGKRCFVLFDEVFKGTNVKDALEASAEVILGFARARGSGFIFSSHLVELVDTLKAEERVRFHYFDGRVVDGKAEYSYRVRPGVSDERMGLHLLREARIPELLAQIAG